MMMLMSPALSPACCCSSVSGYRQVNSVVLSFPHNLQDMMLSRDTRRKVAVHITGAVKAAEQIADAAPSTSDDAAVDAAAPSEDKSGSVAAGQTADVEMTSAQPENVHLIHDIWAFKRSQMLYPAVK